MRALRLMILLILVAIVAFGAAKAAEMRRHRPNWVLMNPYFDSRGKWYTRCVSKGR